MGIIVFVILYQRRIINHQVQMREFNRQKQFELMHASIRSEEEERMRIATELHDDVGATLSSVRLFLHQAVLNPGDENLVTRTKELLDEGIRKVRDLSHQLQPGALQYLGLAKAVQSLADTIGHSGAIQVGFIQESNEWPEIEPQTELSLYRVIQELVNNIIKHSGALQLQILLHYWDGRYCISIAHDGRGLTEAEYQEQLFKKGAIGLKNIENRLKTSNLSLVFPPSKEGLYTIAICLPINQPI